jgi:hypothetical protein
MRRLSQDSVQVSLVPVSAHAIPTAAALPTIAPVVAISEPIPATLKQATEPAVYDSTSAADAQLCNVERGFRASRMSLDEFRQIKKVLQEE